MKLYLWQPVSHGPLSVTMAAESQDEAFQKASEEINKLLKGPVPTGVQYDGLSNKGRFYPSDFEGWGTNKYILSVHEIGKLILTPND